MCKTGLKADSWVILLPQVTYFMQGIAHM